MKLTRSDNDKWLAGVAGGLADSLGVDSTIVRIVFAVTSIFWGGGIVVYLVLWAVMPRSTGGTIAEDGLKKAQDWNDDRKARPTGAAWTVDPDSNPDNPGSDFKI